MEEENTVRLAERVKVNVEALLRTAPIIMMAIEEEDLAWALEELDIAERVVAGLRDMLESD